MENCQLRTNVYMVPFNVVHMGEHLVCVWNSCEMLNLHCCETGDVLSSHVLIQGCWCRSFVYRHLFQLLCLSWLKAETVEGNWVSPSWLRRAVLSAWLGGAGCPWAVYRVALVSWEEQVQAAGFSTHSGVTAPASLELLFCKCCRWQITPKS